MKDIPVFLIGPARSGTKILRDSIASHPNISKIGYDINFIWKKYNEHISHDALEAQDAHKKVKLFIRKYFESQSENKLFLIEKTVSNTVRIPFLIEIFPNAKFIFLFRDGKDTIESVLKQWNTPQKNSYLFKKILSVPVLYIIPYIYNYAINLIKLKLRLKTTESYVWGVKYKNYESDLENLTTLEFCSIQWVKCVLAMYESIPLIKSENRIIINYEDLISNQLNEFKRISDFLKLDINEFDFSSIQNSYNSKSKNTLTDEQLKKVNKIIENTKLKLRPEYTK